MDTVYSPTTHGAVTVYYAENNLEYGIATMGITSELTYTFLLCTLSQFRTQCATIHGSTAILKLDTVTPPDGNRRSALSRGKPPCILDNTL